MSPELAPAAGWSRSLPCVVLITGIQAAGKSTVAQLLAERLPRSVHLRGDAFRTMIVNGRAPITSDMLPDAVRQLRLRYRLAAQAADTYVAAGFTVVVQDVVVGDLLGEWPALVRSRPFLVGVLAPRREVVAAREAARRKHAYGAGGPGQGDSVAELDRVLREQTPRLGLWLDNSDQTPEQTADELIRRLPGEGAVS